MLYNVYGIIFYVITIVEIFHITYNTFLLFFRFYNNGFFSCEQHFYQKESSRSFGVCMFTIRNSFYLLLLGGSFSLKKNYLLYCVCKMQFCTNARGITEYLYSVYIILWCILTFFNFSTSLKK